MKNIQLSVLLVLFTLASGNLRAQTSPDNTKAPFETYGSFNGQAFVDYYYKISADTLLGGTGPYANLAQDQQAFDLRRLYVGYDYHFSENIMGQVLLAHEGNIVVDGSRGIYVKAANLQFSDVIPMAKIVVGQQSTPTFSLFTEKVWGYRSIEKTIADLRKAASSNDLGVGVWGNFDSEKNFGYNVLIGNGNGPKPETDRFRRYYGALNGKLLDKALLLEVYGDYQPIDSKKSESMFKGFIGYDIKPVTIGLEAYVQQNRVNDTLSVDPLGVSAFVHGNIMDNLGFFARYDLYDPNTNTKEAGYKENLIIAGVDYMALKSVHIMPNVEINSYAAKSSTLTAHKSDVTGRLTFFYKY